MFGFGPILTKNTQDPQRKAQLLQKFEDFHFTSHNLTIFPFGFPAKFITREQSEILEQLTGHIPNLKKDKKIIADALFNSHTEVLLTTDREHLANDEFRSHIQRKGLAGKIMVCTPKELYEHLQKIA